MDVEFEVTSKTCGKSYVPQHRDYVQGTWRTCPPCRKPASKSAYSRGGSGP